MLMVVFLGFTACKNPNKTTSATDKNKDTMAIDYPETKKVDTVDTYFGIEVKDPYRWLEYVNSPEVADWVAAQNKVTYSYLEQIPYRQDIKDRLSQLWNYERLGIPQRKGDYVYFSKNDGLQDQSVIYRYKVGDTPEDAEIFLNPNKFSEDGTTSLGAMSFSEDGKLLAYSISKGGSDWRSVIVIDVETKEQVGDTLKNVKFSGISWKGNDGFYYSSYDKPEGNRLYAKTDQHKLYYHKLNTPQESDRLIFGGTPEEKHRYVGGGVSEDNRYLVIFASNATSGNDLYLKDLTREDAEIIPIIQSETVNTSFLTSEGNTLYLVTDLDAPNSRVVTVNVNDPSPENWKDFIPETDKALEATTARGYVFAHYLKDAVSQVIQYDMDGQKIREVNLPGLGSVGGFSAKKEEPDVYYVFTNYVTPSRVYKYDVETGKSELYWEPEIDFDPEQYVSKQVFYHSKDGTKVPMMITYKKGTPLDGKTPTILYGYGGFNISLTPSFSVATAAWLEMGGIYAVPNIRGGGEYGQEWHLAGTKMNKQNVFDDFIAAAEYLIENKYTSSDYLAIRGGSNGGLLVGATMTQRPELMAVALPAVGVLDMLRYHKFTAGAGWAFDYGTSEDSKEMFKYLYAYSPVHNVVKGTEYPATLITTGDHDDRVVPAHSFKFAAELQAKQVGTDPVLIRIQTNAGHGAGKPTDMVIQEYADTYAFTLFNMGIEDLKAMEAEE